MEPKLAVATSTNPLPATKDTLVAFAFENELDQALASVPHASEFKLILEDEEFRGKQKELRVLYPTRLGCKRFIIAGLGKRETFKLEALRRALACSVKSAQEHNAHELVVDLKILERTVPVDAAVEVCAEAVLLASHKVDDFQLGRKQSALSSIQFAVPIGVDVERALASGLISAQHTIRARDLVNRSPSVATPQYLADYAREYATGKVEVTVFDEDQLREKNMGGILAVGKGSRNPPRLLVLEYKPLNPIKKVALVGKGITFDSGGMSLKPSAGMETMKCDKSGAVAVIESIFAAQRLNIPIHILGVCALAENMPGENAYKLGDIIHTSSGKTIEVLNTDAEGRIVLADALHYAVGHNPDYIVDLATLTGACVVALGNTVGGIMGNDQPLILALQKAGEYTHEKLWQLPLDEDYAELLKSPFADLKNVVGNGKGAAGAITAAFFLKEFVGDKKWAHLDIAGPAWLAEEPTDGYRSIGGTGFGVRLLLRFLADLSRTSLLTASDFARDNQPDFLLTQNQVFSRTNGQ